MKMEVEVEAALNRKSERGEQDLKGGVEMC